MKILAGIKITARSIARIISLLLLISLIGAGTVLVYLLNDAADTFEAELKFASNQSSEIQPFPLGVDPVNQKITENINVEAYLEIHFATDYDRTKKVTWLSKLYRKVAQLPWYQSLASPTSRILVIYPGERKEEIAVKFGKILGWDRGERNEFVKLVTTEPVELSDGTLFPGKYVALRDATPEEVAKQIQASFNQKVLKRYPESLQATVSLEEAITIASLIEREASSFSDMRDISGVIWKRLFKDMKLQLDATLQYARGSRTYETKWWPVPKPQDKFIDSPYNTYQNEGLPPGPIGSPSAAAIIAALNPTDTECLFYFHSKGEFVCTPTYEEHVGELQKRYGTGR